MMSHVCVIKNGLVCHAITPRTLLDAHGPKEVSESKQDDLTTHRKFFRASQSQPLDSLTGRLTLLPKSHLPLKSIKIMQKLPVSESRGWL